MATTTVDSDRAAFLEKVCSYRDKGVAAEYALILDELIQWSAKWPKLKHLPNTGSQDVVRFVVSETGLVFWAAYAGFKVDAKVVFLCRPSDSVPEETRDGLRAALKAYGDRADNIGTGTPTVRLGRVKQLGGIRPILEKLGPILEAL